MGIQTAAILYPVNTTTVDTGTGIDIRLLDSAEAGADDDTQTAQATHAQDDVERTFDPATGAVTNTNNAGTTLFKMGWALRLTEDMTPSDDTNCNAVLTSGSLNFTLSVCIDQTGGTYTAGNYGPTWRASLWRYDPATDTGTLIGASSDGATSWNYTPAAGDLGTFKSVNMVLSVPSQVEFAQGEILLLQVGLNTGTVPNPTLGTATWTYKLRVDNSGTNITFAASQGIRQVCFTTGAGAGIASVAGVPVIVLPAIGAAAGIATAVSELQAQAHMTGSAAGIAAVSGVLQADAEMTGAAAGAATVTGAPVVIVPTVGTAEVGGGGGTTVVIKRPIYD